MRVVPADDGLAVAVTPLNSGEGIRILKMPSGDNLLGARFLTHTLYNSRSAPGSTPPLGFKWHRLPIFVPDPTAEIIVLEQRYKGYAYPNSQLLVISTSRLIDICRINPCGTSMAGNGLSYIVPTTVIQEWNYWGPLVARWLPCGMKRASKRPIYGSRLLVYARVDYDKLQIRTNPSPETALEGIRRWLILLDFNSRFFSRADSEEKDWIEEQIDRLVNEVSRCSRDTTLPVSTKAGLRYRSVVIQGSDKYQDVYLDGDIFLGLAVCSTSPSSTRSF